MKETGLMFKAPLVRAILSGQKTQTRRILKNQRSYDLDKCPMGQPGDRIYVRETFAWVPTACESDEIVFAADYQDGSDKSAGVRYIPSIHMPKAAARIWLEITGVRVERLQYITEQDAIAEGIESAGDFFGCPCWKDYSEPEGPDAPVFPNAIGSFQTLWDSTTGRPALPENTRSKRYARVKHWLDTHPDTTGWAANPWVWVIDFKRIEKP